MSKFWFFLQEAFRALRRNGAPSMAAIVTTVVTVILLGVLIPIFQATQAKSSEVRGQLQLRAYIFDDATKPQVAALQTKIEGLPHVKSVQFLTKADARREFNSQTDQKYRDAFKALGRGNPLPANFIVRPDDAANLNRIHAELSPPNAAGKATYISPLISGVGSRQQSAQQIEQATGALKVVLTIITFLLIIASLMLVGNTIRLSIYTRRREVEVMRLVGATRWFIRWPFMIEGVVVGIVGSLVAILILWLGKITIVDPLSHTFTFLSTQNSSTMSFPALIAILFFSAVLVSTLGSGITLRRFLKV
jgi:cell division transport system permease protein